MSELTRDESGQWRNAWGLPTFEKQPPEAGLQRDGTWVLHLERPIQLGQSGKEHVDILFRRPTGKAMRSKPLQPNTSGDLMVWAGTQLCGLTSAEIDLLDGDDVVRFEEVAAGFFTHMIEHVGSPPLVKLARRIQGGGPPISSS